MFREPLFLCKIGHFIYTGCSKLNFTILNVNNVRTNIHIATPAICIDIGNL